MKKIIAKKLCLIIIITIFAGICLPGYAADPGSNEDPLVSLSYINDVLMPQIKSYVDSKSVASAPQGTDSSFYLVNLKAGQTVIGAQGTQFILRMGSASIVATNKGGIADVTAGCDLSLNAQMPANHLLIVPFDDWRGVSMKTDGILMIKGVYSVH